MGRTVRDTALESRTARARLRPRSEPYWRLLREGAHLGYYRGARVGKWVARFRKPGSAGGGYDKKTLGAADDFDDADGEIILSFAQAQDAAREWFDERSRGRRKVGPYTVDDALDDYLEDFPGKTVAATRKRADALIRPELGSIDTAELTVDDVAGWHRGRAAAPARLRTAQGAEQRSRPLDTDDARRRRKSTANRDLTVLKAALNAAYRAGKIASDEAWRKVKPFAKVEKAKLRYLSDDEARRLVNATGPEFRPMVQAALLTGARYSELAAIRVVDVDLGAGTVWLTDTKAGVPRVVYLEDEGRALFERAVAGRSGDALVFPRPDGRQWGHSQQSRYLADACARGKIAPKASFHDLRRTYGARLAIRGVPMTVIAEALGHADDRVTRRHYAHLAPNYVADTVRANVAGLGIVQHSNVRRIGAKRNRSAGSGRSRPG